MSEVLFIRLIVGALLSATGVDASCPIELSPPSVVVKYGTSVAVSCSTSHPAAEGMGWEVRYGGTNLMKVRNVTWAVENLTDWNIKPMCYVNLPESSDAAVESQCRQILPVTLYKYPKNVTISRPTGLTGPMTEKEEYILTCVVEDIAPVQNLSVTWYKGNTTVIKTERFIKSEKKPVVQSSVLVFRPSRDDDGVGIRCEAQLNLEPQGPKISVISEEYPLEVHYGPDINCWDIDILEGENLERKCQVTGNPLPNVAWWKDGKPWDPTVPLVKEDTGIYTIEVQGNTDYRTIVPVLVSFAPKLTCQKKLLAVEHSTPDNLYKIESYPDSTITFYKDGEEVSSLDNLTRHDSGQYTIVATNSISNDSCILELHVLYAPSPIVELEDTEIEVGSSGGLKCTSTGNPRPVYTWNYYETPNVKVDNEDGVSRLHVQNATGVNIGSYTCHAWNSLGNISKTVRVTVKDATFQCPIEIIPERMVVAYQDKGSVTCEPNPYPSKNIQEIHWWVTDHVIDDFTWTVDRHEDWDARAFCVATFEGIGTCRKPVDFTLYKMPDSVVIHSVNHDGPMVAGTEYQLRCDVLKVAPVQNLTVRWYQGNESVKNQGTLQVTNCTQPNKVPCDGVGTRGPVNVSSTISVILDRNQSRVEFRCEAELDLNSLGSPLTMASGSLQIAVLYEPVINTTKLRSRVPVFRGYPAELVCEAEGRPPPQVRWISEKGVSVSGGLLTVSEAGVYTCNATNEVASSVLVVEVIFEEDYLPLIAGFVAVTVVVISVIFVFIYSIYYKNTKMRRYSLKNPKLSTLNGNVAHNGWDMQLPMTKLS